MSAFCSCAQIAGLTAKEKSAVVADWERFVLWRHQVNEVELGRRLQEDPFYVPAQWTSRLYHAFIQYFNYIAHHNRQGFFAARMCNWNDFMEMLQAAAMKNRNHYNTWGAYKDCEDLNNAMQDVAKTYIYSRRENL